MRSRDEMRLLVRTFIEKELARGHPPGAVDQESLVESGIIDSVGIMKLVAFLERELSVKITDAELLPENFDTVEAIVALVEPKAR